METELKKLIIMHHKIKQQIKINDEQFRKLMLGYYSDYEGPLYAHPCFSIMTEKEHDDYILQQDEKLKYNIFLHYL